MVKALLKINKITKKYLDCAANNEVSFEIFPGEIHALLGENGAGKSTLVKIIYGIEKADRGDLEWEGSMLGNFNPNYARKIGIGMVFQHFSLFEAMSIEENIALGIDKQSSKIDLKQKIIKVSCSYGLPLNPEQYVYNLSVGEKQRIEIVRCLLQNPKLLIMDEPTSVLNSQEIYSLFDTLRQLAKQGCAILYISHKLQEIKNLCHKATIMRQGRVIASCYPAKETVETLAEMMIGVNLPKIKTRKINPIHQVQLELNNINQIDNTTENINLKEINLKVKKSEILGIAGIAGNGQSELLSIISGESKATGGDIILHEQSIGHLNPVDRRIKGLSVVPEERNGHGSVAEMTLVENALLSAWYLSDLVDQYGLIKNYALQEWSLKIIDHFKVKILSYQQYASSLSGGNLQKFIIGREMLQRPRVFVVAQPTWGIDAGATHIIHQNLLDLKSQGASIVIISQDLDELFMLCDCISILAQGKLSPTFDIDQMDIKKIGKLMEGNSVI